MKLSAKPSKRFAEYTRKIACGEWEDLGLTAKGDKAVLRHTSGATVAYGTHDGGNDYNGPRNFAQQVQRICGCKLIEPRGRKRGRAKGAVEDLQLVAARRKHARGFEARLQVLEEDLRQRRAAEAEALLEAETRQREVAAIKAAERRRRDIEELMR